MIRKLQARLEHLGVKIEIRNQSRVHLWYPGKHGLPYPPCRARPTVSTVSSHRTRRWASGARRTISTSTHRTASTTSRADRATQSGPNFSAANYAAKAARWKPLWPEITVIAAE